MSDTETALVERAKTGDRAAFEELVRRSSRLVFARLYLETGSRHRAEDLLQETLLRAYKSLRKLTEAANFRAWLLAIAHNAAIDASRRKRPQPAGDEPLAAMRDKNPSPDEAAHSEDVRGKVLAALRSLPEEYRMPLALRYLTGADYESIGEQLGLTNGSLRGFLHRGLKMLRERLPEELGE